MSEHSERSDADKRDSARDSEEDDEMEIASEEREEESGSQYTYVYFVASEDQFQTGEKMTRRAGRSSAPGVENFKRSQSGTKIRRRASDDSPKDEMDSTRRSLKTSGREVSRR